ncbi:Wzz/FepE/Etk N-terminal domain-containing protein [Azonexus sp. IMCC34842]|uniref:Wzz/FepE/Etk N-terminal domain-containing protein n=1 Tax=Azonexus sp. IMCC34842 TaxID=3420950 RepID=UPI003D0B8A6F
MNGNEVVHEDEVSLFDLWEKLRGGWCYVVGGTVVGTVCAGAALMVLPPKYEAVAVVQVGVVGVVGQAGVSGVPGQPGQAINMPIEPAAQAVERMKTPAFQLKVAERVGNQTWVEDLMRSTNATTKYISLQIVKATATPGSAPLIELNAKAETPELARKIADESIKELAKREGVLAKPMIEKLRQDLAIARERLASAERELQSINKLVVNVGVKDDRFTQLSLMTDLRVQKESDVFKQRQAILALETALGVPYTQPAEALEDIFVTDKPVSPKKSLILFLGLICGLLVGVVSVFIVGSWRRSKRERAL